MNLSINTTLPELKFDRKRTRVQNCPCGKSNKDGKFVPYQGYELKGFCHSCSKTFLPELSQEVKQWNLQPIIRVPKTKPKPSTISIDVFKASLSGYDANNFTTYLTSLFDADITKQLIERYYLGTSKYWSNSTVFWQVDAVGKIRTGKIMLYNANNGKRVKKPKSYIYWVHRALKLNNLNLNPCLFCEHLLKDKTKTVALVESEKTAIIASVYLPEFIWLATGSISQFTAEKCQALKGRKVVLYPDLNAYDLWREKAKELQKIAQVTISKLLIDNANNDEIKSGLDLADYLTRAKYKPLTQAPEPTLTKQIKPIPEPPQEPTPPKQLNINDLHYYFGEVLSGDESFNFLSPITLSDGTNIIDVDKFIISHIKTVAAQENKPRYKPYLDRLNLFYNYLISIAT